MKALAVQNSSVIDENFFSGELISDRFFNKGLLILTLCSKGFNNKFLKDSLVKYFSMSDSSLISFLLRAPQSEIPS